jgi:hypothetical protein
MLTEKQHSLVTFVVSIVLLSTKGIRDNDDDNDDDDVLPDEIQLPHSLLFSLECCTTDGFKSSLMPFVVQQRIQICVNNCTITISLWMMHCTNKLI